MKGEGKKEENHEQEHLEERNEKADGNNGKTV